MLDKLFNIIITLFLSLYICDSKRYDKYKFIRGIPASEKHLEFLNNVTEQYNVNVWRTPSMINAPVDFIISPEHADIVISEAQKLDLHLMTLNNDIQSAFDNQTVNTYSRRNLKSFNWHSYYRYGDICDWMTDLSKQYPKEITVFSIGKTIEGNPIRAMKMVLDGSKKRSSVIVEGGIHAREWIAPAVVTYIINSLIGVSKDKDDNNKLYEIALNYEWYFVPVVNVDGYEYSHTTDHMWRKNRRGGYGVDVNRNFAASFGTVGVTTTNKNSQQYCGTGAFSEPESQHLRDFIHSVNERLQLSHYIGFHSYGQMLIIPYAYSKDHSDNFDEMKKIGDQAAMLVKERFGTKYCVGTAYDCLRYMASGVSACWAKKTFRIPYAAVFELRDLGDYGFALPPNQILDTCMETMDGFMEILKPGRSSKLLIEISPKPDGDSKIVINGIFIVLNTFIVFVLDY